MTRVIIADGRPEVRAALRLVIEQRGGCQVSAEAASYGDLHALLAHRCAELIFLDIDLPGTRDEKQRRTLRATIDALNRLCPGVRVLAMSSRPDARAEAVAARADGFLCKSDPPEMLHALLAGLLDPAEATRNP